MKRQERGSTPLDDFSGLIPKHVRTQEDLNLAEFENISAVLTKYFLKKPSGKKAPFNLEWFRKLHKEMYGCVWKWAGEIRKTELSIGIKAHQIVHELHRLQVELKKWEEQGDDALMIAAKLHHRLVWIHPFQGGNGRWARMASNIFLYKKDLSLVEWPEDEARVESGFRKQYLEALKAADAGDLDPVISLHRTHWKRS